MSGAPGSGHSGLWVDQGIQGCLGLDKAYKVGGVWVGIQECEGWPYDLVLFNSPKTGSTLALSTVKISAQAVWEHIHASNRQWEELNAN